MLDTVILLVILALVAWYVMSTRARRRAVRGADHQLAVAVKQGPVPGYSMLPGELIRWDPNNAPPGLGDSWTTDRMETLHAGRRKRVVLTLRGEDLSSTDRFSIMKTLALRLYQRTRFEVVAVQFLPTRSQDSCGSILIYAPDGGGWTGTTTGATLTARLPDRDPFRMPQ